MGKKTVQPVSGQRELLQAKVLQPLRDNYDTLTKTEKKIASYFLSRPDCLVLETHLIRFPWWKPYMRFYPGTELGKDPTNWWGPNRACIEAMLRDLGFSEIKFRHPDYRMRRGIFHARR